MTRKYAREIVVQMVYGLYFDDDADKLINERLGDEFYRRMGDEYEIFQNPPEQMQKDYITRVFLGVCSHMAELDGYIEKYAVGWKFGRLPLMAVAAMRVAMFEALYMEDVPNSVCINEAVEISKKYEPLEITSFINGILGTFVRREIL